MSLARPDGGEFPGEAHLLLLSRDVFESDDEDVEKSDEKNDESIARDEWMTIKSKVVRHRKEMLEGMVLLRLLTMDLKVDAEVAVVSLDIIS